MENNEDLYRTSDIGLAATLLTIGFVLVEIIAGEERKFFVFKKYENVNDTNKLLVYSVITEGLVEDYWNDKILVPARKYHDNFKMLKTRLFQAN